MKPLKITMEGFGPYLKKTEIDLQKLGNNGLYLITGNTGAGKTTIFDAISYALFGDPSGETRSNSMLRCNYAGPQTPTYVELDFEFRGKKYSVIRNPEYTGMKKSGTDTKTVTATACFKDADGQEITGLEKVNQAVISLLGIIKEQFGQIAMIAQGNFQKILFDSTKDRIPVFRNLFKTEKFQELTKRLGEKNSEITRECEDLRKSFKEVLDNFNCNPESPLIVEFESERQKAEGFSDKYELFTKIIKEDEELSGKKKKEIEKLQDEISEIDKQIAKAEQNNKAFNDLEKNNELLKEEKERNQKLNQELEEANKEEKTIKTLSGEVAVINSQMETYSLLEEKLNVKKNLLVEIENCESEQKELEEKLSLLKEKENKTKDELNKLSESGENILKLQAQKNELDSKLSDYKNLKTDLESKVTVKNNLTVLQKNFLQAKEIYNQKAGSYESIKNAFMNNLAGILSKELKEGEPCPVCGSKNHDAPCKLTSEDVSKEKLDSAEKEYKRAGDVMQEKAELSNKENVKLEELEKSLSKKLKEKELNQDLTAEELLKTVNEKLLKLNEDGQELNQKLETEKNNKQKKEELEKEIPELLKQIEEKANQLNQKINQLTEAKTKSKATEDSISELKKNLKYNSKEEAENEVERITDEIEKKKKLIEDAKNEYDESTKKISGYEASIKTLSGQVQGKEKIDISDIQEKRDKFEEQSEELNETEKKIFSRIDNNKNQLKKLEEINKELIKKEEKFNMITNLYKTASGDLKGGRVKIQLETYVQMAYLDRVIHFANERLKIMTDGQYELIRKKEAADFKSIAGLDIDVIDHYNGGIRSVKSLSGGESFQASLSLALGLSDVVRHSASGIKIDTMFIDEGFGTLDTDTLEKAFKSLMSLTEETDRLIGIISHVDVLKEKIRKQIRVTKNTNGGSSVEVVS